MGIGITSNATTMASSAIIKWLDTPYGLLARIETLVVLATFFLTILVILGSYRRRSSNTALKVVLWTAYTLSDTVVSYTVGLMESAKFRNALFAVWVSLLVFVEGSASSISAYALSDNENWKRQTAQFMVMTVYAFLLINACTGYDSWWYIVLYVYLIVACMMKIALRIKAMQMGSHSNRFGNQNKAVADYMSYEHELANQDESLDPVRMRGYKYLVHVLPGEPHVESEASDSYLIRINTNEDRVITTDKIWRCQGRLLNDIGHLKDVCLSFALFNLLRRRFAGYPLAESSLPKTRDFVMRGLLSREEDDDHDHERTFRVIEVELAFLYDTFYTQYPLILYRWKLVLVNAFVVLVGNIWILVLVINHHAKEGETHLVRSNFGNVDVLMTAVVLVSMFGLGICETLQCLHSNWLKVFLVCLYLERRSWQGNPYIEKVLGYLCRKGRFSKPWERKLGQYSLLDSFGYDSIRDHILPGLLVFFLDEVRKGQKASDPIELPIDVKKAVLFSLRDIGDGQLRDGVSALERNGVSRELSWACRLDTHAHTILVWHVATSLCEIATNRRRNTPQEVRINRKVANSLSQYCAYLVAFAPELLPDHKDSTSFIFDKAIMEARSVLDGCKTEQSRYQKLMAAGESEVSRTILVSGARLGRQLIQGIESDEIRWKILAEFWADSMLYLAPSNNVTAHAEHLAAGGEFITHLWVLLTHAGILERPRATN